jgi:mycothiol synthase
MSTNSDRGKSAGVRRIIRRIIARPVRLLLGPRPRHDAESPKQLELLQMVWPPSRLTAPPTWTVPEGYLLRTYQPGDELEFFCLMESVGFKGWTMPIFETWLQKILPDGFFFAVEHGTGKLAATAMACHNPTPLHPFGATLSCVGTHPDHQGSGLGYVVSAAVTCRLLQAGYKEIYLETHDWRLPAIKAYLKLGWVPFLFQEDMPGRWKAVCETLGWPYTSQAWPTANSATNQMAKETGG